jgi:4-hydroxybenzoate polyprenyltransferase
MTLEQLRNLLIVGALFLLDFAVVDWLAKRYEMWGLVLLFALFMVAFLAGWAARTLTLRRSS